MSNNYKTVVLADSPIRYYRLNETSGTVANDLGSQAQNGTLTGGITLNQAAVINADSTSASMLFNGSTGVINIPTTGLPTGASPFTMECWVKIPGTVTSSEFMGFGSNATTQCWFLDSRSGAFDFRQWAGSSESGGTPAINTVFHVVGTYDGTTAILYINGSSVASSAATSAIVAGSAKIGNFSGNFANTYISEVAWYSTNLTAAKVLNHYNTGISNAITMGLVVTQNTISKNDINQLIYQLQQPSGGSEAAKYNLSGNSYIAGGFVSVYLQSLSRTSVPVSASIDQADTAKPANFGTVNTGHLTMGGVQIFVQYTAANAGGSCAGNCTFNY